MSDYISREKAKKHFYTGHTVQDLCKRGAKTLGEAFSLILDDVPAADVRPVVRGRNIWDTVNGHCEFKCSVCGVELSSVYGGNNDFGLDGGYFNFCPNCGAMLTEHCFNSAGEPLQHV